MTLEEAACKLECQDLIVQYFTGLDGGDRSKVADLFTEDAQIVSPRWA